MIKANNVEDQTGLIRELKHSVIFKREINAMLRIKHSLKTTPDEIKVECASKCEFMFKYYTDLFNKILKDEVDLMILNNFVNVLEEIENGEIDQHEGAFKVGTLLKEMYIDSALKKADKLNGPDNGFDEPIEIKKPHVDISWRTFKKMHM